MSRLLAWLPSKRLPVLQKPKQKDKEEKQEAKEKTKKLADEIAMQDHESTAFLRRHAESEGSWPALRAKSVMAIASPKSAGR